MDRCIAELNTLSDLWWIHCRDGVIQGGVWLIVLTLIWRMARRRLTPKIGYGLFFLLLVKLVIPWPVVVPRVGWESTSPSGLMERTFTDGSRSLPVTGSMQFSSPQVMAIPMTFGTMTPLASARGTVESEDSVDVTRATVAMLVWVGVVVLVGIRLGWIARRTWRLVARARPVTNSQLKDEFRRLCRKTGAPSKTRLLVADWVKSPMAAGLRSPCVLVPKNLLEQLSPKQRAWVLSHELTHIRRGDLWVNWLQCGLKSVFFFNPVVWLTCRMLDELREFICDEVALRTAGSSAVESGRGLLAVVEYSSQRDVPLVAVGIFGRRRTNNVRIRNRIVRLLDTQRKNGPRISWKGKVAVVVLALIMLPNVRADEDPSAKTLRDRIAQLQAQLDALRASLDETEPADSNTDLRIRSLTVELDEGHNIAEADEPTDSSEPARCLLKWKAQIVGPGGGRQDYRLKTIDVGELNAAVLRLRVTNGAGECAASLDLFDGTIDLPPAGEAQESLRQEMSVASLYGVQPNSTDEVTYRVSKSKKLSLCVTGDWFSPVGSTNDLLVEVFAVPSDDNFVVTSARHGTVTIHRHSEDDAEAPRVEYVDFFDASGSVEGDLTVRRSDSTEGSPLQVRIEGTAEESVDGESHPPMLVLNLQRTSGVDEGDVTALRLFQQHHASTISYAIASGRPVVDERVTFEAPNPGEQNYRVIRIGATEGSHPRLLIIRVELDDGQSAGSFDLFPGNVEVPDEPDAQENLRQTQSLASLYDVPPGRSGTLIVPLDSTHGYQLGVTGNWLSDQGTKNKVRVRAFITPYQAVVDQPTAFE